MVTQNDDQEKALPLMPQIAAILHWCEEVLTTISGVLLVIAVSLPVANTFAHGNLYAPNSAFESALSVFMTVGIDGQLIGAAYRLAMALRYKRNASAAFEVFNVLLLGALVFLGGFVSGYQQTFNVSTDEAFTAIGISAIVWLGIRMGTAVYLIILSGIRRYVPPKPELTPAQIQAQNERKLAQMRAKQELAAARLNGWINTGKAAIKTVVAEESDEVPEDTADATTAEDSPAVAKPTARKKSKRPQAIRLVAPKATPEQAQRWITEALSHDINMSNNDVCRYVFGKHGHTLSTSTVARYKDQIKAQMSAAG